MNALIFLSYRTIANGVKRTFRTPARLIGTLAIIAYWATMVLTRGFNPGKSLPRGVQSPKIDLPSDELLFAFALAAFLGVLFFRVMTMFAPPGRYKPSDADVLFPTPISPKLVMLHRFVSDFLLTLFIPLLIYFIVRGTNDRGISDLFRTTDSSHGSEGVGTTVFLAFLLISLFSVALSYAVGMAINRDTPKSIVAKRIVTGLFTAFFCGVVYLVTQAMFTDQPLHALVDAANSPLVRVIGLPATAAAEFAISPLRGGPGSGAVWAGGLLFASGLLIWIASLQSRHLYDMASRRSIPAGQARDAARTGDMTAHWTRAAQEGRMNPRSWRWISTLRMPKAWALVWRDLVLQYRIFLWIFLPVGSLLVLGAWLPLMEEASKNALWISVAILGVGMMPMMVPGMTQSGFQESLRRVDVLKPLPFSTLQICLYEALAKAASSVIVISFVALIMLGLRPEKWQEAVAILIALPPICVLSSGISWITALLFPDISDPAQRFLRGLAMMAGFAAIYVPGGLIIAGGIALKINFIVMAVVLAGVSSLLAYLAARIAAPMLTRFNPAD